MLWLWTCHKTLSAALSLNNADTYRYIVIYPARRSQLRQRRQRCRQPVSHFNHRRLLIRRPSQPTSTYWNYSDVTAIESLSASRKVFDKLERLLSVVCEDPDNIVSWKNLLLFSFCCFAVPGQRGGKHHSSTLSSKMNKRISDF